MHQLDTFYNSLSYNDQDSLNSAAGGNFLYKSPTEGLQIIENKAKVRCSRNAVMRVSTNAPPSSSTSSSSNFEFQQWLATIEDNWWRERCTTCGSNHSYNVCPMNRGAYDYPVYHDNFQQFQQAAAVGGFVQGFRYPLQSGLAYDGPLPPMPPPYVNPDNEDGKKTKVTKDKVLLSTKDIQPLVNQKSHDPVKPTHLPYPQRMKAQKQKEKNDMQLHKFLEMFQKLHFNISLAEALVLMPKYTQMMKALLSNKEKLLEIANTPLTRIVGGDHDENVLRSWCSRLLSLSHVTYQDVYDSSSPTSTIVEEFDSLVGEIIKQKEEVKKISDPVARRRACFTPNLKNFRIIHQGRVIHSPQIASVGAISHIFPNNNLEDSFKMGDEDLNFIPNKELDKEDLIPIPRESKIGKECDFPLCDDFQSFKTFSNPLFEKKDDFP
ncbi:hypothetical protein Tco_1418384 [Tanacetum coccineum]